MDKKKKKKKKKKKEKKKKKKRKKKKMGPFKKYVTCTMPIFIPFNYLSHFVNFTLTLSLCYSLNFTNKL